MLPHATMWMGPRHCGVLEDMVQAALRLVQQATALMRGQGLALINALVPEATGSAVADGAGVCVACRALWADVDFGKGELEKHFIYLLVRLFLELLIRLCMEMSCRQHVR